MSEVTTEITGYESKAAGSGTIHKFSGADGKTYQTWKDDIADQAKPFLNAGPVVISFTAQQSNKNGRVFTDLYLDGVAAAGGNAQVAAQEAPVVVETAPALFEGFEDSVLTALTEIRDAIVEQSEILAELLAAGQIQD